MIPRPIQIGGRSVGPGAPCFIIAEAGVNHNGSVDLAKKLVDAAKEAGADAVKFQTWVTEKSVTPDAPLAGYQRRNVGKEQRQFDMLKALELRPGQFEEIKAHADRREILFFSTPDEEESADLLDRMGVRVFKIGSGEVTNLPFLRYMARKKQPLILSTGMSDLGEVEAAVRAVRGEGKADLVLLHCVSSYPALPAECNLRAMDVLADAFGCPVGFSDHTPGTDVAAAAAARGACVLEKHLTLDKSLPGPDHGMSMDPGEFKALVRTVRTVESALGNGIKRVQPSEFETKAIVQRTIVAARAVPAGAVLQAADLALRRATGGLAPSCLALVEGRRAKRPLPENAVITWEVLE